MSYRQRVNAVGYPPTAKPLWEGRPSRDRSYSHGTQSGGCLPYHAMKHSIQSPSFSVAAALILGAATAFAQTSTQSPSTSTSSSATDSSRYGTGTNSPSSGYGTSTSGAGATSSSSGSYNTTAAGSSTGSMSASTDNKLGFMERRFVTKAADANKAEIQIAQLAAQRASNAEVRSYAQKLVDEHSKVSNELMTLAGQKNVKLDQDDGRGLTYRRLANKSGVDFDQEFVEHMIDEHEDNVRMFEKAAADTKDADLRAFASKHVASLRQHLQQAQALRASSMPTGRTDSTYSGSSDSIAPAPATTSAPMSSTTTPSSSGSSSTTTSATSSSDTLPGKATGTDRSGDNTTGGPSSSAGSTGSAGSSSGTRSSTP